MGQCFSLSAHTFMETCIMADITTELASKYGISPEMARKGLGTLLAACKHALPADAFAKIEGAIPGGANMVADAQAEGTAPSEGVLGSIKDMASRLFGGGGSAALAGHLNKVGFSADQAKNFFAHMVEHFKSKLPPDMMKHVHAMLPQEEAAAR
jgi:hypothetical protein